MRHLSILALTAAIAVGGTLGTAANADDVLWPDGGSGKAIVGCNDAGAWVYLYVGTAQGHWANPGFTSSDWTVYADIDFGAVDLDNAYVTVSSISYTLSLANVQRPRIARINNMDEMIRVTFQLRGLPPAGPVEFHPGVGDFKDEPQFSFTILASSKQPLDRPNRCIGNPSPR